MASIGSKDYTSNHELVQSVKESVKGSDTRLDGFPQVGHSYIRTEDLEDFTHDQMEIFKAGEMEVFRKETMRSLKSKEAQVLLNSKEFKDQEATFYHKLNEADPSNAQSSFYSDHLVILTVWQKVLKMAPKILFKFSPSLLEQKRLLENNNSNEKSALDNRVIVITNMIKQIQSDWKSQKEGLGETKPFEHASALNMALLTHVVNDLSMQNILNGPSKEKQQLEFQDTETVQRKEILEHNTIRRHAIFGEAERELSALQKAAQIKQQQ